MTRLAPHTQHRSVPAAPARRTWTLSLVALTACAPAAMLADAQPPDAAVADVAPLDAPVPDAAVADVTPLDAHVPDAFAVDTRGDAPAVLDSLSPGCHASSECAEEQSCVFHTPGCDAVGRCEHTLFCATDPGPYCGCDHADHWDAPCNGPDHPFVSTDTCAARDAGSAATDALASCGDGGPVDFAHDPRNCGACGVVCCGLSCVSGQCFADGVGLTVCAVGPNGCRNMPYDLSRDPAHCGACDVACSSGQQCVAGRCG